MIYTKYIICGGFMIGIYISIYIIYIYIHISKIQVDSDQFLAKRVHQSST
jgi:hypothetical protein